MAEVPVAAAPNLAFPFGGFWVRLVAYILDWAAILLVESFVGFFVLFTLGVGLALRGAGDEATGFVALALSSLAAILVTAGYYVLMPPLLGATLGKLALGYHIVGEDGRHIGYGRAFLRYVGYWLSSIALGLGFIWIGVDAHKQGWHDKVAGTYVVRREVVKP